MVSYVLIRVTRLGASACRKTTAFRSPAPFLIGSNWSKIAFQALKSLTDWMAMVYAAMIPRMVAGLVNQI